MFVASSILCRIREKNNHDVQGASKKVDNAGIMCYKCIITSDTVGTDKEDKRQGGDIILLDYKSGKPIYEQIAEQVKVNVMKGYLKPGDAIPSVRKLALELKITPGTVSKAYQELERQQIIETVRGKGTFIVGELVARVDEARLTEVRKRLAAELLELKLMGYGAEEILEMVKGIYEEMGGC